jgi:hypothetical protein
MHANILSDQERRKGRPLPSANIEGYSSLTTVQQGESIDFHVSSRRPGRVRVAIVDALTQDAALVFEAKAGYHDHLAHSYEFGCNWPPLCSIQIPRNWPSGLYYALISNIQSPSDHTKIFFVIKAAAPGATSQILLQFASTTYQAYNAWGGKSLYPSDSQNRARKVSFDRPGAIEYEREFVFLFWLRENGIAVECCTSVDLHHDDSILNNYQMLVSVGHDEYWSKEMRDNVESFIAKGGNVAFFSGNVCWWQMRFGENHRSMICYKNALEDPLAQTDSSRVTVNWHAVPLNRPENFLTGVSFRHGAGIWQPCESSMSVKGFKVRCANHWVFDGTGLRDDDWFGLGEDIVGYETDAAHFYDDADGNARLVGDDGTPPSFIVLATADLQDWAPCGKGGYATMGIYRRTGSVFTAATTDWVRGLFLPKSKVSLITLNVIRQLRNPCAAS